MDHPRPWLRYVDAGSLDDKTFALDALDVTGSSGEKLGRVDGFIIDVDSGRPYHVVVEAGHWFKHKHFLLPIGHVTLDRTARKLVADVPKERVERFPGFDRSEFEKLSPEEISRMAASTVMVCDVVVDASAPWASWKSYEYPSWWEADFYRPERIEHTDEAGVTTPPQTSTAADRRR
jgi:sporulation protein YlmC with PRC-barrel domain